MFHVYIFYSLYKKNWSSILYHLTGRSYDPIAVSPDLKVISFIKIIFKSKIFKNWNWYINTFLLDKSLDRKIYLTRTSTSYSKSFGNTKFMFVFLLNDWWSNILCWCLKTFQPNEDLFWFCGIKLLIQISLSSSLVNYFVLCSNYIVSFNTNNPKA